MASNLEYDILDVPERDDFLAWIFLNDVQVGEVCQENGKLLLSLYADGKEVVKGIDVDTFITILSTIKQRL